MKLCDLHTHILPNVDDGAPTTEYALKMLRNAAASDVTLLAATPHCNGPYNQDVSPVRALQRQFLHLQQAAADIPVQLVLGAEALVDEYLLPQLQNRTIPTINGSRYLLTEFPFDATTEDILAILQKILELNYIPLVAHPERYIAVCNDPKRVFPWLDMGCHLQLTGGSILGAYGKTVQRTAAALLQQDLVACVASDAHGLHRRSNYLLDVYDHLAIHYSKQYARCLMYEIPMGICHDADI